MIFLYNDYTWKFSIFLLVEVIDLEIRRIICIELNGSYVIFKYGDSFLPF